MSELVERVGRTIETALLEELTMNAVARAAIEAMFKGWYVNTANLGGHEYRYYHVPVRSLDAALEEQHEGGGQDDTKT